MSKLSVKFSCGNLLRVALLPCLGALAGVPLEVGKSGASIVGSTAEYADVMLHGDYVIGEGAAVTNVGALLDIGPDAGDDAMLTVRDGGQYVGVGGEQNSRRRIVIGRNGGRGKIVVSDVKQRDKPSWTVNDSRFSSEEWNLSLSAEADASSDTMDIVRIDTNAFFSIWCVSNYNTAVKARILFNGGTYYQRHRCSVPFCPVIGSEIILEATEGNDIRILRKAGQLYNIVWYRNRSGILRFRGAGDVILEGAPGEGPGSSLRPGFRLTECCSFEQSGDLVIAGTMLAALDGGGMLPFGDGTGAVVLRDATSELRTDGRYANAVNALLGCGMVSNSSYTATLTFTLSNNTDRVLSKTISPSLTWLDSAGGYECVKYGSGAWLADSTPSVPKLTIAQGSVRVTADATVDSMKGRTVEFKPGTSLAVEAGTWSTENTIFHPDTSVSVADGATYRHVGDDDGSVVGADLSGMATVEKDGSGTLTIYESDAPYAGTLRVLGGTVRLSARGDTNDFWRLTIMQASGDEGRPYINQLAEIGLHSASDREHSLAKNFTDAPFGTAAPDLNPGEITVPAGTELTKFNPNQSGGLKDLFDGARWSNFTIENARATLEDEASWFPVTLRLMGGHAPVDSFRMVVGWPNRTTAVPQAWKLESSLDGIHWETRTARLGGAVLTYDSSDGTVCDEYVRDYATGGAAGLSSTSVLRVDGGATLDLGCVAEGSAPCGGLEFDCSRGGGTITRFEPVKGGTLRIVNFPDGGALSGYVLPLSFGSVADASNLSTWKVLVDGEEKPRALEWAGGNIRVAQKGIVIVVR